MAVYAAADGVTSFFICKLSSRIGRTIPLTLNFLLDIGNYMICLFWIPTDSTVWLVYIIFMIAGTIDGIWQPLINGKQSFFIARSFVSCGNHTYTQRSKFEYLKKRNVAE